MSEELDTLQRIEALLKSLLRAQLSDRIQSQLKDPKRRKLYQLTGSGTARDLASKVGLSKSAISIIWQDWERLGFLVKNGNQYRKVI